MAEPAYHFDALIYIGRFQPFHNGHLWVVQQALAQSASLIVLVGSAGLARNIRNPWLFEERRGMLLDSLSGHERQRVSVQPLADALYDDDAWLVAVRRAVEAGLQSVGASGKVGLIGHDKDHTSYYLKLFPEWESVSVGHYRGIDATPIRESLLRGQPVDDPVAIDGEDAAGSVQAVIPDGTRRFLAEFAQSATAAVLCEEQLYIDRWRQAWAVAPYPPVFVTVDALVVCQGHLLLIERGRPPGRGLWALPGGFLDQREHLLDACLRELGEETGLEEALPRPVLRDAVQGVRVFDEPQRSVRGRTITHAYLLRLKQKALPQVRGADDASRAFWLPLDQLAAERMFEDHFFIIRAMLAGEMPPAD